MDKIIIKVSKDYTTTPGVREEIEGDFPGEEFLDKILLPCFEKAIAERKKLFVDLDGTAGYATSFLEASFGGLSRIFKDPNLILGKIELKSEDDPFLIEDIEEYIKNANAK